MMQEILEKLNRVRGVGGCLVLSPEGLPMASALRQGVDESQLAAALSGLVEGSGRLTQQFELGKSKMLQTISPAGGVLLLAAGPSFLAIIMDPAANLALLQLEARPFAERIAQRLTL